MAQQHSIRDFFQVEEGVLHNQHIMSIPLWEQQRLVKDGYCFRERQSEQKGKCEGTRGGSKRGVQKTGNKRDKLDSDNEIEHERYKESEEIKATTRRNFRE